jgi:alpha-tubulin suppressor-like RCC1 family protein
MKKFVGVIILFLVLVVTATVMLRMTKTGVGAGHDKAPPVILTAAAGGYGHSIAVQADRSLLAWGSNEYGQLGDGTSTDRENPVRVKAVDDVTAVAAGYDHTVVLKVDGTVWTWGANTHGQLGERTAGSHYIPSPVKNLADVTGIAAGVEHTVALKKNGTVWAWGDNTYGQLGDGTKAERSVPVPVTGMGGVIAVAAGREHTVALKSDGTVWAWGANEYGQLGDGTTADKITPVQVAGLTEVAAVACGYEHTIALKQDGTVWSWGANEQGQLGDGTTSHRSTPVPVKGLVDVIAVSGGREHTIVLKKDGTVRVWGSNRQNQLGSAWATYTSTPVKVGGLSGGIDAIVSGGYHTIVIKKDGTAWAWGYNKYGQLGDGTRDERSAPVLATLRAAGTHLADAAAKSSGKKSDASVIACAGGMDHTIALMSDGTVWTWGINTFGQLGDGTKRNFRVLPMQVEGISGVVAVSAGNWHSVALKADGTVWAWGDNQSGQIGDGSAFLNRAAPVQVAGLSGITHIACGETYTIALKNDGTVWAWGSNRMKFWKEKAVIFKNVPAQVNGLHDTIAISGRFFHILALKKDGTVWSWGSNPMGQLGDGSTIERDTPAPVKGLADVIAIAAGRDQSVALKKDGTVWAWGGIRTSQSKDPKVALQEMTVPAPVQIGELTGVVAIAAGKEHAVALKKDGTVWTWGSNRQDQLGSSVPYSGPPRQIRGLSQVNMLSDVVAVFCGDYHNMAIKKDRSLWAWGYNQYGELGDGTSGSQGTGTGSFDSKQVAKMIPVRVKEFTFDSPVRAENIRSAAATSPVASIAAGGSHTIVLKGDGTVWTWGENEYNQLGDRKALYGRPGQVQGVTDITAVSGGTSQTVALKNNGTVFEWGRNLAELLFENKDIDLTDRQRVEKYGLHYEHGRPPKGKLPTPVGELTDVISVESGNGFSLALRRDGTVWSWGWNAYGQLGDGTITHRNSPVQVKGLTDVTAVAAGGRYALALKKDGSVWAWGTILSFKDSRDMSQAVTTTPIKVSVLSDVISIAAGADALALSSDGTVWKCWTWGRSSRDVLEPIQVAGLDGVIAISSKGDHAMALKRDGTVWTWGKNHDCQLGDGTRIDRTVPVQVEELADVSAIAAGGAHSVALKRNGEIWTWGAGNKGQLGDGGGGESAFPVYVKDL